eukprot:scaffold435062_cov36-Prasinocladus_malaysianus.AAC.2
MQIHDGSIRGTIRPGSAGRASRKSLYEYGSDSTVLRYSYTPAIRDLDYEYEFSYSYGRAAPAAAEGGRPVVVPLTCLTTVDSGKPAMDQTD